MMDESQLKENRFYLSRKLIGVVAIFILAASGLTVLTNFSINMIAASGDYSALLSQWNHYHYQAGMQVERLVRNGSDEHFEAYQGIKARKDSLQNTVDELFAEDPDVGAIFEIFDKETVYPNEVAGLITVFRYFNNSHRLQEIYHRWEQLTAIENRQHALVDRWYEDLKSQLPPDSVTQSRLAEYNTLNEQWNSQNQKLMASVGDASDVVKHFGLWISVILGILLVLIGVVFTVRANKSIGRWEDTLHEKEALLTEIHHRVKNNMAVVSGMLELESMQSGDSDRALRESRDRIKSMAIIHEILYQSDSFSQLNLADYLHELIEHICNTYNKKNKDITFEADFNQVQLNINQAVPVGLIINEVIVNVIEYGYKEQKSGVIYATLHEIDESVHIQIKDYGDGLPADVDLYSSGGTGPAIIDALVRQVDGELTIESDHQLNLKLVFRKSDASGSSNALF